VLSSELTLPWFTRRARLPFIHKLKLLATAAETAARPSLWSPCAVERQDELREVRLGVPALVAEGAHEVGEGELPALYGLGIMFGVEPQVAVKCRATLRCATDLSPIQMHHILIDAFGPRLGAPLHKALVQVLHAA